jgi:hypothetical protein
MAHGMYATLQVARAHHAICFDLKAWFGPAPAGQGGAPRRIDEDATAPSHKG